MNANEDLPKLSDHKELCKGYLTFKAKRHHIPGKWPAEQKTPPVQVFSAYSNLVQRLLNGDDPAKAAVHAGTGADTFLTSQSVTVAELVDQCLTWADAYSAGTSHEAQNLTYAARELLELFGETEACRFGPKKLRQVQERIVAKEVPRKGVNRTRSGEFSNGAQARS